MRDRPALLHDQLWPRHRNKRAWNWAALEQEVAWQPPVAAAGDVDLSRSPRSGWPHAPSRGGRGPDASILGRLLTRVGARRRVRDPAAALLRPGRSPLAADYHAPVKRDRARNAPRRVVCSGREEIH